MEVKKMIKGLFQRLDPIIGLGIINYAFWAVLIMLHMHFDPPSHGLLRYVFVLSVNTTVFGSVAFFALMTLAKIGAHEVEGCYWKSWTTYFDPDNYDRKAMEVRPMTYQNLRRWFTKGVISCIHSFTKIELFR